MSVFLLPLEYSHPARNGIVRVRGVGLTSQEIIENTVKHLPVIFLTAKYKEPRDKIRKLFVGGGGGSQNRLEGKKISDSHLNNVMVKLCVCGKQCVPFVQSVDYIFKYNICCGIHGNSFFRTNLIFVFQVTLHIALKGEFCITIETKSLFLLAL